MLMGDSFYTVQDPSPGNDTTHGISMHLVKIVPHRLAGSLPTSILDTIGIIRNFKATVSTVFVTEKETI